jgi:hypothetical protein
MLLFVGSLKVFQFHYFIILRFTRKLFGRNFINKINFRTNGAATSAEKLEIFISSLSLFVRNVVLPKLPIDRFLFFNSSHFFDFQKSSPSGHRVRGQSRRKHIFPEMPGADFRVCSTLALTSH